MEQGQIRATRHDEASVAAGHVRGAASLASGREGVQQDMFLLLRAAVQGQV